MNNSPIIGEYYKLDHEVRQKAGKNTKQNLFD